MVTSAWKTLLPLHSALLGLLTTWASGKSIDRDIRSQNTTKANTKAKTEKSWLIGFQRRGCQDFEEDIFRDDDSAIYTAISHLKEGEISLDRDLRYEMGPEIVGTLTFDKNSGKPYSTNNLVGNTKMTGWNGTAVPPKFCHLVAVGDYHGLTVIRQALVKDPPFPYSLASAGRIEGENMEVFGLPEGKYSELPPGETMVIEDADKEPSHIVSNSTGDASTNSILLGVGTSIAGDVKAAGVIEVNSGAQIQGNILPHSDQQNLPTVDFAQLDPADKNHTYAWDSNAFDSVVGRARHQGNLTVGDLKLAEGMLFVDGDLTVTGTIVGKGALVATGDIIIKGSMDTHSDHAALVAQGDIKVEGLGRASSRFQGLVYSEGSINIKDTTIMGAAVSKDDTGLTKLENVIAVAVPELNSMNLDLHVTLEEARGSGAGSVGGTNAFGILQADGTFTQLTPNGDTEALKALGAAIANLDPGPSTWQFGAMGPTGFTATPSGATSDFIVARQKWDAYRLEHKNNQVQIIEIFDIDLNTLISIDYDLEMMYHSTVPHSEH